MNHYSSQYDYVAIDLIKADKPWQALGLLILLRIVDVFRYLIVPTGVASVLWMAAYFMGAPQANWRLIFIVGWACAAAALYATDCFEEWREIMREKTDA